jgi:hypothetical protein
MANLITKVVRSGSVGREDGWYKSSGQKSNPTNYATSRVVVSGCSRTPQQTNTIWSKLGRDDAPPREGSNGSEIHLAPYPGQNGITKTVETTIVVDDGDEGSRKSEV